MMNRLRMLGVASVVASTFYVAAYLGYRQQHVEIWAHDGQPWLILRSVSAYYVFRPLCYVNGWLSGLRFHIGPHPPPVPAQSN